MDLISSFEPRDKAAILEDNLKKNSRRICEKKELSSQRREGLLFWSTSRVSMMSIVAESQQKQDYS